MRRALAFGCAVLLASGTAAAEPGVRAYAEPHLLAGVGTVHGTEDGAYAVDQTGGGVGVRVTLGARIGDAAARDWRLGGAFTLFDGGVQAGLLGIESSVDWSVSPAWRLGPRFELAMGDDGRGEGVNLAAGITARHGWLIVGLDVFGGPSYFRGTGPEAAFDGYSGGIVTRLGLGGRPGVYVEAAGVGVTVLAAVFFAFAMGSTH